MKIQTESLNDREHRDPLSQLKGITIPELVLLFTLVPEGESLLNT